MKRDLDTIAPPSMSRLIKDAMRLTRANEDREAAAVQTAARLEDRLEYLRLVRVVR